MPIWGWVGVGLAALAVVAVALLVLWGLALDAYLTANGEDEVAWVMMAHVSAYRGRMRNGLNYSYAQVVFTPDGDTSDEHLALLKGYGDSLRTFRPAKNAGFDQRMLGQVFRDEVPYFTPTRLPDRLTGGAEVYTASIKLYWNLFPLGRLTEPYVYCTAVVEKHRGIRMTAYPEVKRPKSKSKRRS